MIFQESEDHFLHFYHSFSYMISYCQVGKRRYDLNPIQPYIRNCWEIQAVTSGELILLEQGKYNPPKSNHIWMFGPSCPHGWTTQQGCEAEIFVIHFLAMPDLCRIFCAENTYWERNFADFSKIIKICNEIIQAFKIKNALNGLIFQKLQAEILLLLFEGQVNGLEDENIRTRQTVSQAISWMQANLELMPSVEEAALNLRLSESQLRRLFMKELQLTPREVLGKLKRERACLLLRDTAMSVDQISRASGYENASNFTRAFKKCFHQSPSDWRTGLNLPQYGAEAL